MTLPPQTTAVVDTTSAQPAPRPLTIAQQRKAHQLSVDRWYDILGFCMAVVTALGAFLLFAYVCYLVADNRHETALSLWPYLTPLLSGIAGVVIGALFTRAYNR